MTGKSKKGVKKGKKTKGKGDAKNKQVEVIETQTITEVEKRETETQTITQVEEIENQTRTEGQGGNGNGREAATKAINGSESEEHEGDKKRKAEEGAEAQREGDGGSEDDTRNKKRKLALYCSKPNIKGEVMFEVLDAVEDPRYYHICDLETMLALHSVTHWEAMGEEKVTLGCQEYDTTLKDWIEQHTLENGEVDSLCENYQAYGIKRPNDQAREIIRGILISVCDLHEKEEYHGGLENLENYMIKFVPNYECRIEQARADVTFRYKNMKSAMPKPENVEEGQQNDIWAVSTIIFGKILEGIYKEYPNNLQDLYKMLMDSNMSNVSKNMRVIANHTSLWHWRERIQYFDRLSKAKKQCGIDIEGDIYNVFKDINSTNRNWDWRLDVPPNTPLDKVFNVNSYASTVEELVRFIRIVYEHMGDVDEADITKLKYIDESSLDWASLQRIESEITSAFPMFLVAVYKGLSAKGIYV